MNKRNNREWWNYDEFAIIRVDKINNIEDLRFEILKNCRKSSMAKYFEKAKSSDEPQL